MLAYNTENIHHLFERGKKNTHNPKLCVVCVAFLYLKYSIVSGVQKKIVFFSRVFRFNGALPNECACGRVRVCVGCVCVRMYVMRFCLCL